MKCFLRLVCKTHSDLLIENCGVKILDHRMLLKRMNKRKVLFKGHATYHRLVWYHFILLGNIGFKILRTKFLPQRVDESRAFLKDTPSVIIQKVGVPFS